MTKYNNRCSSPQTSPIYYPPKPQKYPNRHFLDPPKTVIPQPEKSHSKNIAMDFSEGQPDKDIDTNFPYQEEAIKQKYNRPTEKH